MSYFRSLLNGDQRQRQRYITLTATTPPFPVQFYPVPHGTYQYEIRNELSYR
ncbi:MAG TPA: hypothetical protein VFE27_18660 [Acidobacteriaceae bacterium]|nr:hypothetical protein [Acidobacteriaceae bacterium]